MEKIIKGIILGLGASVLIGLIALLSGTILYFIYPVSIPALLPGLVKDGTIAKNLTWWQSVCTVWVFGILIKASQTNNNNK